MNQSCSLHIMHIISGDLWAGAEVQLLTLVRAMHGGLGANLTVVVLNHGRLEQELRNTGVHVIVLDEAELNGLQILLMLIRHVNRLRPNLIHTHRLKENILGSIAGRLNGNIPSLRTAHGAPEHHPAWYRLPKRIIQSLDWFTGRYLQKRIIAVSQDLAGILSQTFPGEKIRAIENGIDVDAISQAITKLEAGSPTSPPFKVGIAGRLVQVKRIDMVIRTAAYLCERHPDLDIEFHIYGDGPLRAELETLSQTRQTERCVHFEGYCADMTQRIAALDAVMMPSDHEGLPMILLEAMALETPIIAHKAGGIPELLDQGSCGILVREHSPPGYASAIRGLMEDPDISKQYVNNALARVKQHYSAMANARAYCEEYEWLL